MIKITSKETLARGIAVEALNLESGWAVLKGGAVSGINGFIDECGEVHSEYSEGIVGVLIPVTSTFCLSCMLADVAGRPN